MFLPLLISQHISILATVQEVKMLCVCVCVCVRDRETETETERDREKKRQRDAGRERQNESERASMSVCVCACVCVCVFGSEGGAGERTPWLTTAVSALYFLRSPALAAQRGNFSSISNYAGKTL